MTSHEEVASFLLCPLMIFTYQIVPIVLKVMTFRCISHKQFSFTIARPEMQLILRLLIEVFTCCY